MLDAYMSNKTNRTK